MAMRPRDGLADDHVYGSWINTQSAGWPKPAGIVCDRDNRGAGFAGYDRAAQFVLCSLPGGAAGAFGKDDQRSMCGQPFAALPDDVVQRLFAGGPVDGDGFDLILLEQSSV